MSPVLTAPVKFSSRLGGCKSYVYKLVNVRAPRAKPSRAVKLDVRDTPVDPRLQMPLKAESDSFDQRHTAKLQP